MGSLGLGATAGGTCRDVGVLSFSWANVGVAGVFEGGFDSLTELDRDLDSGTEVCELVLGLLAVLAGP